MRDDKRGQFYLLAAIIIVAAIIGFAAVSNVVKKSGTIRIADTGEELGIESESVLEYGSVSDTDSEELLKHFTTSYENYAGDDKEIYFIVGDGSDLPQMPNGACFGTNGWDSLSAYTYGDLSVGTIGLTLGSGQIGLPISERTQVPAKICKTSEDNEVTMKVNEEEYSFEIKPGENFYFVIQQTVGDEEYVVTG